MTVKTPIQPTGCPLCGEDITSWSLIAQAAHVEMTHPLWQRLALRARTRLPLGELLIRRKYRTGHDLASAYADHPDYREEWRP